MRKRISIVWSIPKNELENMVKNSNSLSKVLKYCGLINKGGNYRTLKRRLDEEDIDYSHIKMGIDSNKDRKIPKKRKSLSEVMTKDSTYSRGSLKKRLLQKGILENRCFICDQPPYHNGKDLVMILDHINGISDDHRLENLRLLCPNCNIQQETFAGKRNKKSYYCENCKNEKKYKYSKLCEKCIAKSRRKCKNRPSKDILLKDIKELGYCGTGRKYGVSYNSIRKWLKI